jgi:SAM-dependent methyltransferase
VPDDAYDVVLCQMGLMFMDRPAAVAEMRRVVAPGGRVVVNTPGAIQPAFEAMEQAIVEHISADLGGFVGAVFSMHDPDAVAGLLRDAGLTDVTGTVSPATLQLPAPADFLWQYINLTPMGPFVAQAPEEAQAAMERQFVERAQPFLVDGVLAGTQPIVIASGEK